MRKILPFVFMMSCITVFGNLQESATQKDSTLSKANFYLKELQTAYADSNYEAHKKYSDSLYIYSEAKHLVKYQILAMVNQAVYHKNRSEQDRAVQLYRNALLLTDAIPEDHRTKIIVLVNLGNVYTNITAYEKAIRVMEEVLHLLDTHTDDSKIRAAALNGIANSYSYLEEHEKALEYYYKSKKLGEQIKNESIISSALNNIADTYQKQGNYKKAIETCNTALDLNHTQKPTKQRAWLLITLGISEWKTGHTKKGLRYLNEAISIAEAKGLMRIAMECHRHLSEVYSTEENSTKAAYHKEKYLSLENTLLENSQKATKLDLEKDIASKDKIIKSKESVISGLLQNKNKFLLWSIAFAGILGIVSFSFFIKKKRYQREQNLLQEQFITLKNSYKNKTANTTSDNFRTSETKVPIYKNSSLTDKDFIKYKAQLLQHMTVEKPYLNNELSQSDLAKQLGISSHHLSEVLNTGFNQNFYNFVNSYRVLEAQKLMDNDTTQTHKILAFAFDSGFKSKTSFNRVFKTHTGLTPSEYRKKARS